ncbi:MAG TPA: hypothetical protein VGY55_15630 [Pirellulales bacterium]|nr:hypothetical protein [Pirellulales bacterium]
MPLAAESAAVSQFRRVEEQAALIGSPGQGNGVDPQAAQVDDGCSTDKRAVASIGS